MYKMPWIAIPAVILLAACAVGPDYQRPETAEPAAFTFAPVVPSQQVDEQRFWQGFGDPLLAELVGETLAANQALVAAVARYQRAEALLDGANRERWPSVSAAAGVSETRPAQIERGDGAAEYETWQVGLAAHVGST